MNSDFDVNQKQKLSEKGFTFISLFFLISINSLIHENEKGGLIFLALIFFLLVTGTKSAENFFGTSALALFILLHNYLFGTIPAALIICFISYALFREYLKLDGNLLKPISIYLIIDSVFIFFGKRIDLIWAHPFLESVAKMLFHFHIIFGALIILASHYNSKINEFLFEKFPEKIKSGKEILILWMSFAWVFLLLGEFCKIEILTLFGVTFFLLFMMSWVVFREGNEKISRLLLFLCFILLGIVWISRKLIA